MRYCHIALLILLCAPVIGHESDQYSNRLLPIAETLPALDARVNQALAHITANWRGPRNDYRLATEVFYRIGGLHWVDHLEDWAISNNQLERLPQHGYQSIYDSAPILAGFIIRVFGISPTIRLNGSLVGTDKLGHFLSQGFKYYRRYQKYHNEARVLRLGARVERHIFGYMTTGIYSNADLVANYEGMRFYQSLSHDNIVSGKPAIVGWRGNAPYIQRPFTMSDHVNDYWDEALNPSEYSIWMQEYLSSRLPELCPDYWRAPSRFVSRHERQLRQQYAGLGLKEARHNRMDQVCNK